jgi:ethanolamine-phosphate cytidylyltransferase
MPLKSGIWLSSLPHLCRYSYPKQEGVFRELPSPCSTTTKDIIKRIVDNRAVFEARNAKKVASEAAYYAKQGGEQFVQEV